MKDLEDDLKATISAYNKVSKEVTKAENEEDDTRAKDQNNFRKTVEYQYAEERREATNHVHNQLEDRIKILDRRIEDFKDDGTGNDLNTIAINDDKVLDDEYE